MINVSQKIISAMIGFVMLFVLTGQQANAAVTFADVPTTADTYDEINYLVNLNVIKGYKENGKTYYKPSNSVTRGQAAKMVVVASGHTPLKVAKSSFTDVQVGTEVSTYIERAVQLGFFEQKSGKFNPNVPLTREEMSYVLTKAFHFDASKYSEAALVFPDVAANNTYADYIKAIYYNGVTKGSNGKYMPKSSVTRAQFASFVARAKSEKFRLPLPTVQEKPDTTQVIGLVSATTDGLNVRNTASSSTSANIVGQVNTGGKLSVYAIEGNWVKVTYKGSFAYVSKSYVKFLNADGNSIGTKINTITANEKLDVYYKASSTSKVNGSISKGEQVPVYKLTNGYYLTVVDGLPGYILASKTTASSPTSGSGSTGSTNPPAETAPPETELPITGTTARVTVDKLVIRASASGSAASLGSLKKGDVISVHSISGYWVKMTYNKTTGYVHKSYIKLLNQSGSVVKNRIIILDPGHGGKDPGAVKESYTEKSIVLKVTKLVKQKLEASGAKVYMTRTGDTYPTLQERVDFTNDNYGEIFVSVHVNAATSSSAKGAETYYSVSTGDQYQEDKQLATYINNEIVKNASMTNRGVKEASYYVTRSMIIPSVLVELGFLSNSEDRNKLIADKYVEIYAQSIYNGIVDYYTK